MLSARRLSTWAVSSMACLAPHAHADTPWSAPAHSPLSHMAALDDQALMAVQGAALDAATLAALQKTLGQDHNDDKARRTYAQANQTAQTVAALNAALALQSNMALRLSTTAVSSVNTATQIGGTLIALTPISAIAPIGLPLFGLPSLPPKNNH
ncbi:MAG: hypothetical protein QM749_00900 [Aquabacterium sp.]